MLRGSVPPAMTTSHEARAVRDLPVSRRAVTVPGANLADAVRLCDPFTPLDPRQDEIIHEDLSAIRGGDRLKRVVRDIRRAGSTTTLHFLSGHLGSGKTTELLRMKERLETAEADQPLTTTLFLDADAMLDRNDVDLEDILVALWHLVYELHPVAAAKVLTPIWKSQIKAGHFSVVANAEAPEALKKLLGDIRFPSPDQKHKVRVALGSVTPTFIEGLNKGSAEIAKTPPNDHAGPVVVLIDNLEKLSQGQKASVERLYLERMGALKSLEAHLVITVPLYLCYADAGASLIGLYGGEIVVVRMIETRKRVSDGGGDNPAGRVLWYGALPVPLASSSRSREAKAARRNRRALLSEHKRLVLRSEACAQLLDSLDRLPRVERAARASAERSRTRRCRVGLVGLVGLRRAPSVLTPRPAERALSSLPTGVASRARRRVRRPAETRPPAWSVAVSPPRERGLRPLRPIAGYFDVNA